MEEGFCKAERMNVLLNKNANNGEIFLQTVIILDHLADGSESVCPIN